ncbi:hypothetical protein ABID22_000367 [Pontibacter aydingkolensis]|uniref:Uncharacterized protein n=1 Tax=Pontibacter aydingkolensis TaxID=1911536 RepID=A0ABS7CQB1_9BACT|nr:hypothetical protein [Pontibacter aydingkolensis]MBW7465968.1 hypothetical protein [Pontibacter aydingkolensis]
MSGTAIITPASTGNPAHYLILKILIQKSRTLTYKVRPVKYESIAD